jgi:hypothetical protein
MTYLQYVSEDVPMPEEFVVPIHEKYGSTLIGSGAKNARLKSVSRLIDFIESEERLERESIIGRKRLKEDSFLEKFGIKSGGEHLRLSGYIRQSAGRDLKRAESPRQ